VDAEAWPARSAPSAARTRSVAAVEGRDAIGFTPF
jgi:hypothetical protein